MPTLVVTDVKKGKTREVAIRDARFTIGSDDSNHLVLPRSNIAARHCIISFESERFYVRSIDSGSAIRVDGKDVEDEAELGNGSCIVVGDFEMEFRSRRVGPSRKTKARESRGGRRRSRKRQTTGSEAGASSASEERSASQRGSRRRSREAEPGSQPSPAAGWAGASPGDEEPREAPSFKAEQRWAADQEAKQSPPPPPSQIRSDSGEISPERQRILERTMVKKKIHSRLIESRDLKMLEFDKLADQEARDQTEKVVISLIKELARGGEIPSWIVKRDLVKEVLDESLGLGPLEDLIADESINEIMVNAWDRIYVEHQTKGIILTDKQFSDDEQVIHIIRRIVSPLGRVINEQTPLVDARLKDGSRVNAIIPPLAVSGPSLTIRKFPKHRLTVEDLVKFKSLNSGMAEFLGLAVRERRNICISGGTGSGKTTLLNVVSGHIPSHERIVTVEDVSELRLPQKHVVSLEARAPNIEGKGAIPIQKLVINCLRMRPDRIVVGECRGGEALDMLQAMNTGHDGSLTTVHSNSPRDCIARLETLVLMAGSDLPSKAIREQISSAIHLIIQQARLPDGARKVTYITEVCGMEGNTVTLQDIFLFVQTGFDAEGKTEGYHTATGNIPNFVHELRRRGVDVDMGIFQPREGAEVGF